MCRRFASFLPADEMRRVFRVLGEIPNVPASWNIASSQRAAVVRRHPDTGDRRLDMPVWGLVPGFTRDLKAARKPINARFETAGSSAMFRQALAKRRAVADGKQPFAIAQTDGAPLAFAGDLGGLAKP